MESNRWRNACSYGALLFLTTCGSSDAEFCATLDELSATLITDDRSLRGEPTLPRAEKPAAFQATKALPGAARCEIHDAGSGLVVYSCEYPSTAIEALRDQVDACGGPKLAWDESGRQWYRGAGDDLTLSVTASGEGTASAVILTHF